MQYKTIPPLTGVCTCKHIDLSYVYIWHNIDKLTHTVRCCFKPIICLAHVLQKCKCKLGPITISGLNYPSTGINMFPHSLAPNVFNVLSDSVSTVIEDCIAAV